MSKHSKRGGSRGDTFRLDGENEAPTPGYGKPEPLPRTWSSETTPDPWKHAAKPHDLRVLVAVAKRTGFFVREVGPEMYSVSERDDRNDNPRRNYLIQNASFDQCMAAMKEAAPIPSTGK